ncbi:MAG: WD40 repeat domain-containing protein [Candidatus Omnitrophica bacterium]|nr:WD40 repeat domain-containing protein [Candidatus Omnitrophota bacterium]
MKKIISISFLILFNVALFAQGADWYYRNKNLSLIFSPAVWQTIRLAHEEQLQGNTKRARQFLSKAEDMTLQAKPFGTQNWPSGWPRTQQALSILKYATPDAYIYRILGDYALDNNRKKQAILFFQKYLEKSIIPDAGYLYKLGRVMTEKKLYSEAISVYQNLQQDILIKDFHGAAPSTWEIDRRIRILKTMIKPREIWILDVKIVNTPPFFSSDINELFKNAIKPVSSDKHYKIISQNDINQILQENNFNSTNVINDMNDRIKAIKMLNADYVIEPILYKVENNYVFQVNVYQRTSKIPYETYQYKNKNYEFLPTYFKRFAYDFLGESIPSQYLLPVNHYEWSYTGNKPANWVSSLKMADNGSSIIVGYKNGSVYIFSSSGGIQRTYKSPDEITNVAISPGGRYYAWSSLNGGITFATDSGIILNKKPGNEIAGISISSDGKFWVYALNKKVFYLDKHGVRFWNKKLSDWVENIQISPDASMVGISCYNGSFYLYSDEGNLLWSKNIGSPASRISFYSNGEYISIGAKNNTVFVYNKEGTEITKFISGEKVTLFSHKKESLIADCGVWNKFFYFPSINKKTVWDYILDKNVAFADSNLNADFLIAAKKNSIFAYRITWK